MVKKSIYLTLVNNNNELISDIYLKEVSFNDYQEIYNLENNYSLYTGIDNQDYEKEYNTNNTPLYSVIYNFYNIDYKIYFEEGDIDSEKIIKKSTVVNNGMKFSATIGPEDINNNYKIKFFTSNDTYETKYFGKWANKVDEIISSENDLNTINIKAISGDFLFQNKTSSILEGHDIILATNVVKFDFMGIGNHEFDQGLNVLNALSSMSCSPLLCSNLDKVDLETINALDNYSIIKKDISFGCVSFCTPETSFLAISAKDLKFKDMDYVLNKNEDFLKNSDIRILLFHDNIDNIIKYFELNPSKLYLIDVIITGHQHIIYNGYIKRDDYQVPVIQASEDAEVVGLVEINYNKHKKILTNMSNKFIEIPPDFPQKQEIKEISDWVDKISKPYFEKKIGIIKEYPLNGLRTDVRSIETNLGDLIADANLSTIRKISPEIPSKNIFSIINSGSIRNYSELPINFEIKGETVFEIIPFSNNVVAFEIIGRTSTNKLINSLAEKSLGNRTSGAWLQISENLKFDYINNKYELIGGSTSETDKFYAVTYNYIGNGGDGYEQFKDLKELEYDIPSQNSLIEYIESFPGEPLSEIIYKSYDNRIIINE